MNHRFVRFLRVSAALAALLLVAGPAAARILSANGTPPVTPLVRPVLATEGPLSFDISWQVGIAALPADQITTLPIGAGVLTVRDSASSALGSSRGRFVLDTGSVRELLELPGLPAQDATTTLSGSFSETIVIPPEVIAEARRRNAQRILFVRDFTEIITITRTNEFMGAVTVDSTRVDSTSRRSAAVAFYLTPGIGGDVSVFRVALRFDEGETLKFASTGEELRVWADVFYRGSGRIEGLWEVADPASTSGTPIFRPIERVVRNLGAGQRLSLRGPALPTRTAGLHLVRFRFTGTADPAFADPVIRYQVTTELPGVAPAVARNITIRGPADTTQLGPETTFAWSRVAGSAAYQLELYERSGERVGGGLGERFDAQTERFRDATLGAEPTTYEPTARDAEVAERRAGERVAGVMLPAEALETPLDALTRGHLSPGGQYLWRVIAFAPDGRRLGQSELRTLQVPAPASPTP